MSRSFEPSVEQKTMDWPRFSKGPPMHTTSYSSSSSSSTLPAHKLSVPEPPREVGQGFFSMFGDGAVSPTSPVPVASPSAASAAPVSSYLPSFGVFDTKPAADAVNKTRVDYMDLKAPVLVPPTVPAPPKPPSAPEPPAPAPLSLFVPTFGIFDGKDKPAPADPHAPLPPHLPAPPRPPQPPQEPSTGISLAPLLHAFDFSPRTSPAAAAGGGPDQPPAPPAAPAAPSTTGSAASTDAKTPRTPTQPSEYIYFTVFDSAVPKPGDSDYVDPAGGGGGSGGGLSGNLLLSGNPERDVVDLRRRLVDIETAHSRCGEMRHRLSVTEKELSKVEGLNKEKMEEIIRLKCENQKDRDELAKLQALNGSNSANSRALSQKNAELSQKNADLAAMERRMDEMTRESRADKDDLARLRRQLTDALAGTSDAARLSKQLADSESARAQLQRQADRAAELERQQSALQAANLDLYNKNETLMQQARADQDTIRQLRDALASATARPVPASPKAPAVTAEDKKKYADVLEVNRTLKELAGDAAFQQDLQRPMVQVALLAWSGESTAHIPPQTLESARFDEGVARVYPRLKVFEQVCNTALIRFPVDHIQARKKELSQAAIEKAFGKGFVAKMMPK